MNAAEKDAAATSGLSVFPAEDRYDSLIGYYCSQELLNQRPSDLPVNLWLLVHEQVRQESGFDPYAVSPSGAMGLLQLMPETVTELGVRDRNNPEHNLRGGIQYLIRHCWVPFKQEKGLERLRLAMASYNCGLGNVIRAQKLAMERGLDPSRWVSIVQTLERVTGPRSEETISYVAKIFQAYEGQS